MMEVEVNGCRDCWDDFMDIAIDLEIGNEWYSFDEDVTNVTNMSSTIFGGSVNAGVAEAARSGKYLPNVIKYTKLGGNVVGGVGTAVTVYNVTAKTFNGTVNTSDLVDLTASGSILITGLLISNPIGLGVVAAVGIGYGIYRIGWGESSDEWINNNYGFNNK